MSLKILLISDLHVGMTFSRYEKVKSELAQDRVDVVGRSVEVAINNGCELIIIAGDLFDKLSIKPSVISAVANLLNSFSGDVMILPGNHDYFDSQNSSLWSVFTSLCKDNVHLLQSSSKLILNNFDLPVTFYPCPCNQKHSSTNRLQHLKSESFDSTHVNIGIAHGSLKGFSPDFNNNYFPMELTELKNSGVDYWLLGHTHISYPEVLSKNSFAFYPGTPAPDGFDCDHDGFGMILEIFSKQEISFEKVKLGKYLFVELQLSVENYLDFEEKMENVLSGYDKSKLLLKLIVVGTVERGDKELIIKKLLEKGPFFMLLRYDLNSLFELVDEHTINAEFVEGSFPHRLLSKIFSLNDQYLLQLACDLVRESKR